MNEEVMIPKSYHDKVCEEIIRFKDKQFYDAVHLLDDGTLEITVGDYTKVKRVLVEDDNNFGNLFYEDADRPQGEWETYYPFMLSVEDQKFYGAKNPTEPILDKRFGKIKCNICGNPKPLGKSNYCPNCGAKMKGADDE